MSALYPRRDLNQKHTDELFYAAIESTFTVLEADHGEACMKVIDRRIEADEYMDEQVEYFKSLGFDDTSVMDVEDVPDLAIDDLFNDTETFGPPPPRRHRFFGNYRPYDQDNPNADFEG